MFPYTTEDLVVAERLLQAGCKVLMPWGAPIGSGQGLNNVFGLRAMRAHFPDTPLIVDAGLGLPSHAAAAMELGLDGVLLNTAVAKAGDPVAMARAFGQAVEAGPRGLSRRPDAAARHGRALHPGRSERQCSRDPRPNPLLSGRETLDPFYPIVDSAAWVGRLVGVGARLIQLRIKNKDEATVARETRESLALCRKAGATLIVNDYWRIAIAEGADWVHLGQEDLDTADLAAIRKAGLKLGVSTHDEAELERGARGRSRLCRARADLPDHLEGHGVRPARARTARRVEAPRQPAAALRHRRARPRAGEAVPRRRRRHRLGHLRHHAERRPGGAREAMDRGDAAEVSAKRRRGRRSR